MTEIKESPWEKLKSSIDLADYQEAGAITPNQTNGFSGINKNDVSSKLYMKSLENMIPYKKMAKNKTEIEKYTEMNKNKKLDRFNL